MTSEHRKIQKEAVASLSRNPRHPCVVRTCGKAVRSQYLMCGSHWRKVPGELRGEILAGAKRRDQGWVAACRLARFVVEDAERRAQREAWEEDNAKDANERGL